MAGFFGNSMFGHNFQATAFQHNHGGSTSGFGGSGKKPHDMGLGTGGFGQGGMSGGQMQPNEMHGGALMFHRQNSMLSEMTRSKDDKHGNPWLFTHVPGHVEDGAVLSLYEKPLEKEKEEKKKRPSLKRQTTFGEYTTEPRRAPSFASDPGKMRSRTVSTSSAPGGPGRMPLQRGVSIVDEPEEPMNMDRARPVLRRAQTIAAEKERRRSESSIKIKKPLLPLHIPKFGRRKSTKSSPEVQSTKSPNSETSSLCTTPPRSRRPSSTLPSTPNRDNPRPSITSTGSSPKSDKDFQRDEDPEMAKLILSLLSNENRDNDETAEQNEPNHVKPEERPEPVTPDVNNLPSPTLVSRKVHQKLPPQQDHPISKPTESAKPAKLYPGKTFLNVYPSLMAEQTDSESSDTYYDCQTQDDNVPPGRKVKKRVPRRKRDTSISTCTDGEDTTSTSDTPPVSDITHTAPGYYNTDLYPAEPQMTIKTNGHYQPYLYEDETLPVRGIHNKPAVNGFAGTVPVYAQPFRSQPSVKTYMYGQTPITVLNKTDKQKSPIYENDLKADNEHKDSTGNDTCTADSSESGYATSHKPLSPKDCDIKVLNFVNSLPNRSNMDEEHSDASHSDVLNGSDSEAEEQSPPISNLSNMKCVSGSETDEESIHSNDTASKLEVMKLLESPTEVSARVESKLRASNRKLDDDSSTKSSRRRNSDSSQTEVLQVYKKQNDEPDNVSEKIIKIHENPLEASCIVIEAKPTGSPLESPGTEHRVLKPSRRSNYSFFEKPLLSFRSTNSYQNLSTCTQCMDLVLSGLNVILFLTSAGVIALGLWLSLKNFNVNEMTEILGNNLLQVIIYLSIGGAGAAMLAAFCLCCGVRQDKTGLGFYAIVLVIVIFAFATAAVLSAMFADKLGGIEFKVNFRERLVTKYGIQNDKDSQFFTEAWDKMHRAFECCGVEGDENATSSWAVFKKFSLWYRKQPYKATIFVPESCCRKNSNTEICQGSDHNLLGPPVYGPPMDKYYPQKNSNLNTDGCYELFVKHATMVVAWTALMTGGLAGLYFIVVMLTWVFCFKKSKEDTESYCGDSYYDMEIHNEVFDETDGINLRHMAAKEPPEETLILQQRHVTVHRIPDENSTNYRSPKGGMLYTGEESDITKPPTVPRDDRFATEEEDNDSEGESEDSGTDSGSEDEDGEVDPSNYRRNQWLSSDAHVTHLLSRAITEEDSNYEDSDDEGYRGKQQTTAFV